MGGVVRVKSARGKGTRIEVDVPVEQACTNGESQPYPLRVIGGGLSSRQAENAAEAGIVRAAAAGEHRRPESA
jgi:hypothetical protein